MLPQPPLAASPREAGRFDLEIPTSSFDRSVLLRTAEIIATQIESASILTSAGDPAWRQPQPSGESGKLEMVPVGSFLYRGRAGIALFLSSLACLTGKSRWADLALRALKSTRLKLLELVQNYQPGSPLTLPIGGVSGLGSLIYSFVRIA